ncbi:hypothetical protein [Pollutimonas bauzanensis]|jgi:hypothetical protein|uniref:hypothetical protein n=1 Tax=Pollutimonas bauzanensis TaxID=658167 RepID=UPI00333E2DB7
MNIQSLKLVVDFNRDGSYSPAELWAAVKFFYYLPGNLIVEGLGNIPYVSSAFHIHASQAAGYGSLNGLLSVTLTLIFWILVVFGILTLCSPTVDEVDDATDAETGLGLGQNRQYIPELHKAAEAPSDHATSTSARTRVHMPVSRAVYAFPGKKPKRHPRHRPDMKPVTH